MDFGLIILIKTHSKTCTKWHLFRTIEKKTLLFSMWGSFDIIFNDFSWWKISSYSENWNLWFKEWKDRRYQEWQTVCSVSMASTCTATSPVRQMLCRIGHQLHLLHTLPWCLHSHWLRTQPAGGPSQCHSQLFRNAHCSQCFCTSTPIRP